MQPPIGRARMRLIAALLCVLGGRLSPAIVAADDGVDVAEAPRHHRLVVAIPTYSKNLEMVMEGAKTWRESLRTLIATNGTWGSEERRIDAPAGVRTDLEVWWEYPDNFPSGHRHLKTKDDIGKHEMRWLAAPRLANKSFAGNYDWLLVGDDDTWWFVDNVQKLVRDFDSSLPYILTDAAGNCCAKGTSGFQMCRAQNWSVVGCMPPGLAPFPPPPGSGCVDHPSIAPCRVEALLNRTTTCRYGSDADPGPLGEMADGSQGPEGPPGLIWAYGNYGMILSRGLMEAITEEQWLHCEDCSHGLPCGGGGDVRLGNCLWRFGFAPTLPLARPGQQDLEDCVFGRVGSAISWIRLMDNYLYADEACDELCADALESGVSTHIDHEALHHEIAPTYEVTQAMKRREFRAAQGGAPAPPVRAEEMPWQPSPEEARRPVVVQFQHHLHQSFKKARHKLAHAAHEAKEAAARAAAHGDGWGAGNGDAAPLAAAPGAAVGGAGAGENSGAGGGNRDARGGRRVLGDVGAEGGEEPPPQQSGSGGGGGGVEAAAPKHHLLF